MCYFYFVNWVSLLLCHSIITWYSYIYTVFSIFLLVNSFNDCSTCILNNVMFVKSIYILWAHSVCFCCLLLVFFCFFFFGFFFFFFVFFFFLLYNGFLILIFFVEVVHPFQVSYLGLDASPPSYSICLYPFSCIWSL